MAVTDFKISYTFTVNPEEASTPSQGMIGGGSTVDMFDLDFNPRNIGGASTIFAEITLLENMGGGSTVFANITLFENLGGGSTRKLTGLVPYGNILRIPGNNTLLGQLVNKSKK